MTSGSSESSPLDYTETSSQTWGDDFLNWVAGLGIFMTDDSRQLGSLQYHHFACQANFENTKSLSGFGSHPDRKVAAIKCAAELIERRTMFEYFAEGKHNIPVQYQSSNGWAVHATKELATAKALNEAIERHLLLKAYLTSGWQGFSFVDRMTTDENELVFLISKFGFENKIAGMVICRSQLYAGVSFGYCLGELAGLQSTDFWLPAIFEAVDKLSTLKGEPYPVATDNWIRTDIKYFLETPFDFEQINSLSHFDPNLLTIGNIGDPQIKTFELADKYNLSFPLFAAFVHGGSLIPLAPAESLTHISLVNGRHPIL